MKFSFYLSSIHLRISIVAYILFYASSILCGRPCMYVDDDLLACLAASAELGECLFCFENIAMSSEQTSTDPEVLARQIILCCTNFDSHFMHAVCFTKWIKTSSQVECPTCNSDCTQGYASFINKIGSLSLNSEEGTSRAAAFKKLWEMFNDLVSHELMYNLFESKGFPIYDFKQLPVASTVNELPINEADNSAGCIVQMAGRLPVIDSVSRDQTGPTCWQFAGIIKDAVNYARHSIDYDPNKISRHRVIWDAENIKPSDCIRLLRSCIYRDVVSGKEYIHPLVADVLHTINNNVTPWNREYISQAVHLFTRYEIKIPGDNVFKIPGYNVFKILEPPASNMREYYIGRLYDTIMWRQSYSHLAHFCEILQPDDKSYINFYHIIDLLDSQDECKILRIIKHFVEIGFITIRNVVNLTKELNRKTRYKYLNFMLECISKVNNEISTESHSITTLFSYLKENKMHTLAAHLIHKLPNTSHYDCFGNSSILEIMLFHFSRINYTMSNHEISKHDSFKILCRFIIEEADVFKHPTTGWFFTKYYVILIKNLTYVPFKYYCGCIISLPLKSALDQFFNLDASDHSPVRLEHIPTIYEAIRRCGDRELMFDRFYSSGIAQDEVKSRMSYFIITRLIKKLAPNLLYCCGNINMLWMTKRETLIQQFEEAEDKLEYLIEIGQQGFVELLYESRNESFLELITPQHYKNLVELLCSYHRQVRSCLR